MADEMVLRGKINGQEKYCRLPIRSKFADSLYPDQAMITAESILAMPHDRAVEVIDALVDDWMYWLRRANELFVLQQRAEKPEEE